jgi:hypothetical protein
MRQLLGNLSRKTVVIVGGALGVVLVTSVGLAAVAAMRAPSANAAQGISVQDTSPPPTQNANLPHHLVHVVSVGGNTLTVTPSADKKGQQKTLTISDATKILKYGTPAKLSDIQANEWIIVRGSDSQHIQQITILGFGAQGTIRALNDGGFTLLKNKHSGAGTVTINVSTSTRIQEGQLRLSLSNLQAGENVVVFGNQASGGSLDALLVQVNLVSGQVRAIKGGSITLNHGAKGAEIAVTTSAATKYYLAGQLVSASQLKVGDTVGVAGVVSSKTSVTATAIFIREAHLAGKVLGVDGTTLTIETKSGVTWTVKVNSSTKYLRGGQPAGLADVQPGSLIEVVGFQSGDQTMTAFLIRLRVQK